MKADNKSKEKKMRQNFKQNQFNIKAQNKMEEIQTHKTYQIPHSEALLQYIGN